MIYKIMYIEWITKFHYLRDRNRKIIFKQFEIITSLNKRIYIYLKKIYILTDIEKIRMPHHTLPSLKK